MSVSISRYSSEPMQSTTGSSATAILIRTPLVALAVVLTLVAARYLTDPVRAAAAAGIAFTSPGGVTVARIGFGAFPLGFVVFCVSAMFSERRILAALNTELALLAIVIAARISGMAVVHSLETAKLLIPEAVMAALCVLAIRLELNRQKRRQAATA